MILVYAKTVPYGINRIHGVTVTTFQILRGFRDIMARIALVGNVGIA